jgi:amino-acid N-acetyltransferase
MCPEVTLQPAVGPEGLAAAERLLERTDLPTDDLRASPVTLWLARIDGDVVGVGGLEVHGEHGLLRSVAVAESARGAGVGGELVSALLAAATERGVAACYLLTTDAADFFAAQGFERIERSAVPDTIRGTEQFASLCPPSTTVMRRSP